MNKKLFNFLIFGCFGIAAEIFFTAIINFIEESRKGIYDFRLMGRSYIWMFFIYASVAFLFPPVYRLVRRYHLVIRLLLYAIAIFIVEFITGFLLDKLTGDCPWHYKTGMQVMGYIRLDYLPYWLGFGWLIESLYKQLMKPISN